MKSIGRGQGYRCRRCGIKGRDVGAKATVAEVPRFLRLGFYEVPVCARRHLFKPLKRMGTSSAELEGPPP